MIKIITVYKSKETEQDKNFGIFNPVDMSNGRWVKISEALSRLGHQVDIAVPDTIVTENLNGNGHLKMIPLSQVNWNDYDVVKTVFHGGFDTLEKYGGTSHPFIISKLGSVVSSTVIKGIYFYGDVHKKLFETQEKINRISRYITVLSEPAKELWKEVHGRKKNLLLVPGGVDDDVPAPSVDPYPSDEKIKCIFAGNVYTKYSQPEANEAIINKLNELGKLLSCNGARLYMIGPGDISNLNQDYVNYLGVIPYDKCWDYFYFANVGIVVSAGKFMHNNESTKIYHYLRAGLPVVSESGFPNDNVVKEAELGYVIKSGNMELMARKIIRAAKQDWNKEHAVNYILKNHTWDKRVKVYDKIVKKNFGSRITETLYKRMKMRIG
jgi:glycosyltransferase involved in cell wall biosynthesis